MKALNEKQLYKKITLQQEFASTQEIEQLEGFLNHSRAFKAVDLSVNIEYEGYNLYVMGPKGSGRHFSVQEYIDKIAAKKPVCNDLCYVYNFEDPDTPIAIEMQAGQGMVFKQEMKKLINHLKSAIAAMFKSNEYFFKKRDIDEWLKTKQEDAFYTIIEDAKEEGILVEYNEQGYTISPLNDKNEVMDPKEFKALDEKEKESIKKRIQKYKEQIDDVSSEVVSWSNEAAQRMEELEKYITQKAVDPSFQKLLNKYKDDLQISEYLKSAKKDIIENAKDFLPNESDSQIIALTSSEPDFSVYAVNLLVNRKNDTGAAVVYEDNPTYTNLFGVIEYQSQMGTLVTDFNYIKAGAIHKANGGYLILDAQKVLMQPYVWEGLKRMLVSKKIRIDTPSDILGLNTTVSLKPKEVDLSIKIVLIGPRDIYYLLYNYDEDFQKLFKINADFEDSMDSDEQNLKNYLQMLAKIIQKEKLLPHAKESVEKLLEQGMRISESKEKITAKLMDIADLMKEASFIAKSAQKQIVDIQEVEAALENKKFRASRVMDRIYEAIEEGTILLDLQGSVVGQINAMSVLDMGDISFGEPVKITALTRLGSGEVLDIHREVDLGGPIHSKGVMILSSFLSHRYAKESFLSMSASLSFEQSYGQIEGDSASLAELCAIISSLANLPIDQSFAVTGSINQRGQVQPIGGVNQKIEGFFSVCQKMGVKNNSVIIPYANIRHLMLDKEVVKAVKEKRFFIYAVKEVDEALELLMKKKAGIFKAGSFEKESINEAVTKKLRFLAQKAKQKKIKKDKR